MFDVNLTILKNIFDVELLMVVPYGNHILHCDCALCYVFVATN